MKKPAGKTVYENMNKNNIPLNGATKYDLIKSIFKHDGKEKRT